jgi:hypothetical protein
MARLLCFEPSFDIRLSPPLAQCRENVGVDQEHQKSTSRAINLEPLELDSNCA